MYSSQHKVQQKMSVYFQTLENVKCIWCIPSLQKVREQAGAELDQAHVKLDDLVVVVVKLMVEVEV